ncbi:MAG: carboxypeptidase regulatory-like domain-containing protein [Micropepsaceae bacterium]
MKLNRIRSMFAATSATALLACMFLICTSAFGQGSEGRIGGNVTDQSGASIPNATVTVTDAARGTARQLSTDGAGGYNAPNLTPSTYTVKVEFMGFRTFERKDIVLSVGQEIVINATLQPGQQSETITVTGEPPPINTTSAVLGGTLQPGTIQELPLNGRNFMNLLELRPGITIVPGGGAWTQTTNGLRPEHNVYILDGITAMEPLGGQSTINSVSLAGDAASLLPIDTIQEFATQQNPKAEFGWKPGSITSIALKSGTNDFHGSAAAYGRTDATDARNGFLLGDGQKQEVTLKNWGGSLGGPIKKDKLFFFGAYEQQDYQLGNAYGMNVPSISNMQAACNAVKGSSSPLSPTSLKMAGLDSNCARTSGYSIFDLDPAYFARGTGNAVSANLPTNYKVKGMMGKLDFNLNEKNILNAKYFFGTHDGTVVNSQNITQPYWRPTDTADIHFFGMQWNYIATSALFNSFRVGYNRFYQKFETSDCPGATGAPDYGIPFGYGSTKPVCGFTNITLQGGFGAIGCCSSFPKYYGPDDIVEFIDGLSYLKGKHNMKFGGEYRWSKIGAGGTFNRGRGQTTFGNTTGGFNQLQNFMAGIPTANGQIFIGDPLRAISQTAMALYAQDDWKVAPRFTINVGVRWEYLTPLKEDKNRLGNFVPGTGFTQLGVNGNDALWARDKNNFAPRFGFAWDMSGNGKTVIRGGSTIMFVTPSWWTFLSQQNQLNPTTGINTNPTGFTLCRGAVNTSGPGCAAGVATDPTIGNIASAGVPLTPAQINWNQSSSLYNGNIYPNASDTSVLKCGTNRFCTAQAVDTNLRNAYVFSWSLGVQRQLTPTTTIDVNYVGNHASKLWGLNFTNTPPLGAGYCIGLSAAQISTVTNAGGTCPSTITSTTGTNAAAIQALRPLNSLNPYLSYIYMVQNMYHSNYNGLQVAVTQRTLHGLSFTTGYTWAHTLDQNSGERGGPNGTPFNLRRDYSNGDFDQRHRFTATVTYALPGKKGYAQMLEGWKITSIVSAYTALPWGVSQTGSRSGDIAGIGEFQEGWNFTGNPSDFSNIKSATIPWLAPAAAVNNATCVNAAGGAGSLGYVSMQRFGCYINGNSVMVPPALGTQGNTVRNMFRGSGIRLWTASVSKDIKFGERVNAQFRVESFNVLNSLMYGNPQFNGNGYNDPFSPAVFGGAPSTPDVANNNPSLGSGGPRAFQFGLKLTF